MRSSLQQLYRRWDKLETGMISNQDLIMAGDKALSILYLIFDDRATKSEPKYSNLLKQSILQHHGQEGMQGFLSLNHGFQHGKLLGDTHAMFHSGKKSIIIHRSSLLYRYLERNKRGSSVRLLKGINKLSEVVKNSESEARMEFSGMQKEPEFMLQLITTYLDLLTRHEEIFLQNKSKIIFDITDQFSAISIILHEMTHHVWSLLPRQGLQLTRRWRIGINEAWAHAINVLGNIYQETGPISTDTVLTEIYQIQEMAEFKSTVTSYNNPIHERYLPGIKRMFSTTCQSLRPAMYLVAAALLIDIVLRRNQEIRIMQNLKSYFAQVDLTLIHDFVIENVTKIDNKEIRHLIEQELILRSTTNNNHVIELLNRKIEFNMKKTWSLANVTLNFQMVAIGLEQIQILGRLRCEKLIFALKEKTNLLFQNIIKTKENIKLHQKLITQIQKLILNEQQRFTNLQELKQDFIIN
jgi:hypothetical protein